MNIHQFLLALKGRLWVFLSLLGATVVTAVLVTLMLPKSYDASAALLVDNRDEQSLTGPLASARERTGFIQTQIDIIHSQRVARRVVENLKLAENPNAQAAFAQSRAPGTVEDWIASGLLAKLKVDASQSSVMQIQYTAGDPATAATIANAFAQAYMDTTLRLRNEPSRQAAQWFDEQLKELRASFESSQAKLNAFQKEKGIIATDERLDVENARLSELSTQSLQAANQSYDAASRSGHIIHAPLLRFQQCPQAR